MITAEKTFENSTVLHLLIKKIKVESVPLFTLLCLISLLNFQRQEGD